MSQLAEDHNTATKGVEEGNRGIDGRLEVKVKTKEMNIERAGLDRVSNFMSPCPNNSCKL